MISSATWKILKNQRCHSKIQQTWILTISQLVWGVPRQGSNLYVHLIHVLLPPSSVIDRSHIHHVSVCHRLTSNWCTQGRLKNSHALYKSTQLTRSQSEMTKSVSWVNCVNCFKRDRNSSRSRFFAVAMRLPKHGTDGCPTVFSNLAKVNLGGEPSVEMQGWLLLRLRYIIYVLLTYLYTPNLSKIYVSTFLVVKELPHFYMFEVAQEDLTSPRCHISLTTSGLLRRFRRQTSLQRTVSQRGKYLQHIKANTTQMFQTILQKQNHPTKKKNKKTSRIIS